MLRWLVTIVLAMGTACTTADRLHTASGEPKLVLAEPRHSFAGVDVGTRASAVVRVANEGTGVAPALTLQTSGDRRSFAVGGNCDGRRLDGGETCELQITFSPASYGLASANVSLADGLTFHVDGYGRGTTSLDVRATGDGMVTPCASSRCLLTYDVGLDAHVVTLTASPATGWIFAGWSGACAGSSPSCELVMDVDRAVSAVFVRGAIVSFEAVSYAAGGGSISSGAQSCTAPCRLTATVARGAAVTLGAVADAQSQLRWTGGCRGTAPACALTPDADVEVKAIFNGANYVFVTSAKVAANEGVAAFDATCDAAARFAGLPGPFVAYVSTTVARARARAGTARGFIRLDGLPFSDTLGAHDPVAYPIAFDESGHRVPDDLNERFFFSGEDDRGVLHDCTDWSVDSSTAEDQVDLGDPLAGQEGWAGAWIQSGCSVRHRLLCVGTALSRPLLPERVPGRLAFLSSSRTAVAAGGGVASLDAVCASDARAANVPGSFKALVATAGATAASRFDLTGPPWVRRDGVAVVAKASDLADDRLLAPILLGADGLVDLNGGLVWSGAHSPGATGTVDATCDSWRSASAALHAANGLPWTVASNEWFGLTDNLTCDESRRVFCLQE